MKHKGELDVKNNKMKDLEKQIQMDKVLKEKHESSIKRAE